MEQENFSSSVNKPTAEEAADRLRSLKIHYQETEVSLGKSSSSTSEEEVVHLTPQNYEEIIDEFKMNAMLLDEKLVAANELNIKLQKELDEVKAAKSKTYKNLAVTSTAEINMLTHLDHKSVTRWIAQFRGENTENFLSRVDTAILQLLRLKSQVSEGKFDLEKWSTQEFTPPWAWWRPPFVFPGTPTVFPPLGPEIRSAP